MRPSSSSVPGNPPAAAAFLRGVERRAAMFAQWQCGDLDTGDAAVAATMAEFVRGATTVPFADWPRRFWSLLLAAPALRAPRAGSAGDGLPALDRLPGGPRVVVLLRLAAGLPEHEAAAVLGVSRATYRLGLQRALPRGDDGSPDVAAWRALAATVQSGIRTLPPDRLARLAALREAALRGRAPTLRRYPVVRGAADVQPDATQSVVRRPRWLWPVMAAVALATMLALAATWIGTLRGGLVDEEIRIEALADSAPAARYDAQAALVTERDFELLLAQDADAGWQADPAFFAWLAAQRDLPQDETADAHLQPVQTDDDGEPETSDAEL
ncbi:sigma-70 region 4 domain-containing protein [Luteimonas sp. TWI662]|uniref:sigma-70 region 4 domain-containing protein n=1 Tax=unclassified Luteimonas TaxID=2629088 RepID=UPI003208E569